MKRFILSIGGPIGETLEGPPTPPRKRVSHTYRWDQLRLHPVPLARMLRKGNSKQASLDAVVLPREGQACPREGPETADHVIFLAFYFAFLAFVCVYQVLRAVRGVEGNLGEKTECAISESPCRSDKVVSVLYLSPSSSLSLSPSESRPVLFLVFARIHMSYPTVVCPNVLACSPFLPILCLLVLFPEIPLLCASLVSITVSALKCILTPRGALEAHRTSPATT